MTYYAGEGYTPLGKKLVRWCEMNNKSQAWLAEHVGYSTKHINMVIKGKAGMSPEMAVALAEITGLSAQVLFRLQGNEMIRREIERRSTS